MSETVSAFNPTTGLFSDTFLNATDLNTAFTVKLAGLGVGSGGSGTLPIATTVTIGGVKIDGTTILISSGSNPGVISVGAVPYSSITGTPTLGALSGIGFPAAGIVYSTGSAFAPLTIGANLTLTGSTLAATGGGGGTTYSFASPLVNTGGTISVAANTYDAYGAATTETTRATAAENARLVIANNLSDLASASTARTNLGLGAIATQAIPAAGIVLSTGSALQQLTLGTNLSLSGTTLNAASGGGGVAFPGGTGLVSATGAQVTVSTGLSLSGTTLTATGTSLTVPNSSLIGGNGSALTSVTVGSGLTYSGTTLSVSYGTTSATAAAGNDSRIVGALQPSALPSTTAGGIYGTTSTAGLATPLTLGSTLAITGGALGVVSIAPAAAGSVPAASALQLLGTSNTYFTGTQLGPVLAPIGTASGTYAAGNDSRIIGTPTAVTATGTTQSGAAPLTSQFTLLTTSAGNTAVTLQAIAGEQNISNIGTVAAAIFVLAGSASINGLANTASVSLPAGTSCTVRSTDGVNFKVTLPIDPAMVALHTTELAPQAITAGTSTGTVTLPWPTTIAPAVYEYTLGASTTFALATPPTGVDARIELRVKNDAAGTYTATLPTPSGGWSGVSAPTPPSGANAIAVYRFSASSFGVLGSY